MAIAVISLFVSLETSCTIMAFGPQVTESRLFPFWYLSTYVQFQNYVHRVESFLVIVWLALIYTKIALYSYMALKATGDIFGFKSPKRVQIFLAVIQILAAWMLLANITEVEEVTVNYLTPAGLFFEMILPAGLLFMAFVRKKGKSG